MTGMYRRPMMIYSIVACRQNLRGPSLTVVSIGIFGDIIINVSKSINEQK